MAQQGIRVFLSSGHDELSRYPVKPKTVLSDCGFRSQIDIRAARRGVDPLQSAARRRETRAAETQSEEAIDQRFAFRFNQGGTGINFTGPFCW